MIKTRLAYRYAKALFILAKDQKNDEIINGDMQMIAHLVKKDQELSFFLNNPIVHVFKKIHVLGLIFKGMHNATLSFVKLLARKNRLNILNAIADSYQLIYKKENLIDMIKITTALPLSETLKSRFIEKINSLTGRKTKIQNITNPDIIGGFVLQIDDLEFDSSIISHLNSLRKRLIG